MHRFSLGITSRTSPKHNQTRCLLLIRINESSLRNKVQKLVDAARFRKNLQASHRKSKRPENRVVQCERSVHCCSELRVKFASAWSRSPERTGTQIIQTAPSTLLTVKAATGGSNVLTSLARQARGKAPVAAEICGFQVPLARIPVAQTAVGPQCPHFNHQAHNHYFRVPSAKELTKSKLLRTIE